MQRALQSRFHSLPWWALAVSTLATQSSANSFLGIPAYVALVPGGGLNWLQYELMLPLAMVFVMLVLAPVFRGLALVSVYEYLERRFDRATRLFLSAVFLLSRGLATGVALTSTLEKSCAASGADSRDRTSRLRGRRFMGRLRWFRRGSRRRPAARRR